MKIIILLLFVFTLSSCLKPKYSKETNPEKYLEFELLEDDTYAVVGFKDSYVKDLTIPSTYNNKPVTKIKESSFKAKRSFSHLITHPPIISLTIEEGVKIIEDEAFYDALLEEVTLPSSLEYIGESAFAKNETTINYIDNLKYIGSNAFKGNKLTGEITIKNIEIGEYAFSETLIEKVTFEDDVEIIPEGLFFSSNNLKEINLPKNIKYIGTNAFKNTNIKEVSIFGETIIDTMAFSEIESLEKVELLNKKITLESKSFGNNINLNDINFGNIEHINPEAFSGSPLNNIKLENSNDKYILTLDQKGIMNKSNNELILGGSNFTNFSDVKIIGAYAFSQRNLGDIIISNTVELIKSNGFYFTSFKSLNIQAKKISYRSFYYSKINEELHISTEIIPKESFYYSSGYKKLFINEGTKKIETDAFTVVSDLETLYLPSSLEQIEMAAFVQNHNLKEVYYELPEDKLPVKLYIGNFIIYKSNVVVENNRVLTKLYDDFKIYVNEEMYDFVKDYWSDMPVNDKYIYSDNLSDFIYIRKQDLYE